MANSLCETLLQEIMVIVVIKTNTSSHSKMMNTTNKIPHLWNWPLNHVELCVIEVNRLSFTSFKVHCNKKIDNVKLFNN